MASMQKKTTGTKSMKLATLSTAALYHISSVQQRSASNSSRVEGVSQNLSSVENAFETTLHKPSSDELRGDLKPLEIFTLFPKLPIELQDQIWKFAALSYPRKVQLRSHYKFYMGGKQPRCGHYENNTPVILRQVNQRTRDVCITLGYVELEVDHPYFENPKYFFHPELDVLIIPAKALMGGHYALPNQIQDAKALEKVKFLAIDISDSISKFVEIFHNLRTFRNLEVLFLIMDTSERAGPYRKGQEYFEFEAIPPRGRQGHSFEEKFGRFGRSQQSVRENLQKELATDPERISPHILFIKCTTELPRKYDRRDYGFW